MTQRILKASVISKMQKSVGRTVWEVGILFSFILSFCFVPKLRYISVANFKALINFQELWNLLWKFSFETICYSGERSISKIIGLFYQVFLYLDFIMFFIFDLSTFKIKLFSMLNDYSL